MRNAWVSWADNTPVKYTAHVWFDQEAQSIITNKMPYQCCYPAKVCIKPFKLKLNIMQTNETAFIAPMLEMGVEKKVLNCECFHNRPVWHEGGWYEHVWLLGLLHFLLPQHLYFTVRTGAASERVAKVS